MSAKQSKRKALASTDTNALPAPPKKPKSTRSGPAAAAVAKKYKYSDPSVFANQTPTEIKFILWAAPDDEHEDEEADAAEGDEWEEKVIPGSLQDILDGLANERYKAVHEALNPPHELAMKCRLISAEEIGRRRDGASAPYKEKMEEARKRFVKEGKMTAEEARAIVGQDDETRKEKRKAKKNLQKTLNKVESIRKKSMDLVDLDRTRGMTLLEAQKKLKEAIRENKREPFTQDVYKRLLKAFSKERPSLTEALRVFEEKISGVREGFREYHNLTEEETKAIGPDLGEEGENDGQGSKQGVREDDKDTEKEEAPPRVVTDKGFPITKAGFEKYIEINQEVEKRDQDSQGMYIYNDFSGYGVTEVLENTLAEFNKLIFKKDVSPVEKWAIIEGLTTYLALGDHMALMMNENSESITEVFDMMGVMFITALEMLHESDLIGPTSPLPDNISLMTLFFLDFMTNTATDFDIEWDHGIIRAADAYGVVIKPFDQVEGVTQGTLDDLRALCQQSKRGKGFAWKTEYPRFKREHPGGHRYDITRMSKKEKAQYTFRDSDSENLDLE